ncbi:MAG: PA2779 family protein [Pseudomonadota bacterium]
MNRRFMRFTSRLLIAATLALGMPMQPANAALVGTDQASASMQSANRDRIRAFLEREDVRVRLQAQGISAEAAKARVSALTDEDVEKIAGKLDELPAGGDILGVLLTIFIVLLITDILGFTKVFSFTRPIK